MADLGHAGHETIETVAAVIILIGGAIFTALAYRTRPARVGPAASSVEPVVTDPESPPRSTPDRSLITIMAGLSAGAAVIHLVAAPTHYRELGDLGAGFLVAAAFQAWWTARCVTSSSGPSPWVVSIGIVGNLAILAAWAWTRTIGLPVGPFAGSPEPLGFPDGLCAAFEVLLAALLISRRLGHRAWTSGRADLRAITSIAIVPTLGLVLVLTSLATVAIASGLDHGASTGTGVSAGEAHGATH